MYHFGLERQQRDAVVWQWAIMQIIRLAKSIIGHTVMGRISSAHSGVLLFRGSLNMSLNISAILFRSRLLYARPLETENALGCYYSFDWMFPLNEADAVRPIESVSHELNRRFSSCLAASDLSSGNASVVLARCSSLAKQ